MRYIETGRRLGRRPRRADALAGFAVMHMPVRSHEPGSVRTKLRLPCQSEDVSQHEMG
jgi:hypothetical protein